MTSDLGWRQLTHSYRFIAFVKSGSSASVHHLVFIVESAGKKGIIINQMFRFFSTQSGSYVTCQPAEITAIIYDLKISVLTFNCWESAFISQHRGSYDCSRLMKIKFHNVNVNRLLKKKFFHFIVHISTPEWRTNWLFHFRNLQLLSASKKCSLQLGTSSLTASSWNLLCCLYKIPECLTLVFTFWLFAIL